MPRYSDWITPAPINVLLTPTGYGGWSESNSNLPSSVAAAFAACTTTAGAPGSRTSQMGYSYVTPVGGPPPGYTALGLFTVKNLPTPGSVSITGYQAAWTPGTPPVGATGYQTAGDWIWGDRVVVKTTTSYPNNAALDWSAKLHEFPDRTVRVISPSDVDAMPLIGDITIVDGAKNGIGPDWITSWGADFSVVALPNNMSGNATPPNPNGNGAHYALTLRADFNAYGLLQPPDYRWIFPGDPPLRQRQRDDGLTAAAGPRARSTSRQYGLRQRGYW